MLIEAIIHGQSPDSGQPTNGRHNAEKKPQNNAIPAIETNGVAPFLTNAFHNAWNKAAVNTSKVTVILT
jgi:hypothetical protein